MQDTFIGKIAEIVGAKNVLCRENDTAPYTTDWRRPVPGRGRRVVRPGRPPKSPR